MKDDKVVRLRSKRDKQLDALALRLGDALEGETSTDAMLVCASMIGFLLRNTKSPETKEKNLTEIFRFIREIAEHRREL